MAFCTSCGKAVDSSSRFCPGCGAAVPAAAVAATAPPPPSAPVQAAAAATAPAMAAPPAQPAKSGGGVLKILLVIVLVVFLLGVVAVAVIGGIGYYVAKNTHVSTTGANSGRIETPFGNVEAEAEDPAKIAESMGIEVYPGATPEKSGGGAVHLGDFSVGAASFNTSDPPEAVMKFYMDQYPDAIHTESNGNHTLAINKKDKAVVITAQAMGSETRITLTKMATPKKD